MTAESGDGPDPQVRPVRSTGIGSWPGTDVVDAVQIAFAECPDLPYLPELPARGVAAAMIGRATAWLVGLAVDLQPAGWRLTGASSRDHRTAMATWRSDLDVLEEVAQGYVGTLKLSIAGPWTMAAMVERPRGDRVLADSGARRDLVQSLAEGVGQLVEDVARRLPAVRVVLQLDEPMLPQVLAGAVPTASGFSRHRPVDLPEVGGGITAIVERVAGGDVPVAVHCCAAGTPVELLRQAGARAVALDVDQLGTRDWDVVGSGLAEGLVVGLGVLPTDRWLGPDALARRALDPIRALGLDPAVSRQLVLTPSCGLASKNRSQAIASLRALRTAAGIVTDQLAD